MAPGTQPLANGTDNKRQIRIPLPHTRPSTTLYIFVYPFSERTAVRIPHATPTSLWCFLLLVILLVHAWIPATRQLCGNLVPHDSPTSLWCLLLLVLLVVILLLLGCFCGYLPAVPT